MRAATDLFYQERFINGDSWRVSINDTGDAAVTIEDYRLLGVEIRWSGACPGGNQPVETLGSNLRPLGRPHCWSRVSTETPARTSHALEPWQLSCHDPHPANNTAKVFVGFVQVSLFGTRVAGPPASPRPFAIGYVPPGNIGGPRTYGVVPDVRERAGTNARTARGSSTFLNPRLRLLP